MGNYKVVSKNVTLEPSFANIS